MSANILELDNLCISIAATRILRGVDLQLETGKILGLVGESGGGKTMVCKAILDILPESAKVTAGAIRFEGKDLLKMAKRERRETSPMTQLLTHLAWPQALAAASK